MTSEPIDRNLHIAVLALQKEFINVDQLVAALNAWSLAKHKTLGQILQEQGALSNKDNAHVEALLREQNQNHDPSKSFATAAPVPAFPSESGAEKSYATAAPPLSADRAKTVEAANIPKTIGQQSSQGIAPGVVSLGTSSSAGLRFRILRPHARGGLGEVLVAEDGELHREVALKQIQDRHADDPESRTRFLQEAEITGGLEHPGIVPVYGLGQYADGRPFYAMRFIRGDSLKDAIEEFHKADAVNREEGERNLELRNLLGRFIDVCQAMAYAHSRGVLHRDLKPGNIMLGKYGETLVVDWGLAKPVDQVESQSEKAPLDEAKLAPSSMHSATPTMMGAAVGTPQFMSPEQAAGRLDKMGPASDVYSLGATLYSLLTGRPPVTDAELGVVLQKVQHGDFPRPRHVKPNIPPPLEAVCLKAMALKPEDRYATPRQLADDLEHWLGDEPVSAYPEPWTVRAQRWLRRHRTLATGTVTAIIVAAMGLALATGLLAAANERERQAKDEALIQKAKAEDNFKLARQAVDHYHTEVSESVLLQEPGMQPLRKKLLESARAFYDKFVQERSNDPSVKGELGMALYRLGLITADIESEPKGLDFLDKARQVFVTLAPEHQDDLARCYHHLGRLFRLTNQFPKAEQDYAKAQKLWSTQAARQIENQADLARSQLGLGNVFLVSDKLQPARAEYCKALDTWEKLTGADSARPEYQRDLAVTHSNLAMVLTALGDKKTALGNLALAVQIQEKLVHQHPGTSKYQDDLARSQFNAGDLLFQEGNIASARVAFQAADDLWDKLVKSQPAVTIYQIRLADTKGYLAKVHLAEQQFAKAIEVCRQALDLHQELAKKNANQAKYQNDLGRGHFQLGDMYRRAGQPGPADREYQEALRIQYSLVQTARNVPSFQANLARTFHNLGLLKQEEKQSKEAEESFTQAVTLWDSLHRHAAESAEYTAGLMTAYWKRAEVRSTRQEFQTALEDWDRALLLAKEPQYSLFRGYRALTLAHAGNFDKALFEAQEVTPRAAGSGEALFLLARVYALAAGTKAEYADRAMEYLTQARQAAFFQAAAHRQMLTDDPDLNCLRSRRDFQNLTGDLEGDKK